MAGGSTAAAALAMPEATRRLALESAFIAAMLMAGTGALLSGAV
jgi:hypothetical protein